MFGKKKRLAFTVNIFFVKFLFDCAQIYLMPAVEVPVRYIHHDMCHCCLKSKISGTCHVIWSISHCLGSYECERVIVELMKDFKRHEMKAFFM